MTKSKALVAAEARIQILEATLRSRGLEIEELRNKVAQRSLPAPNYRRPSAEHRTYLEYVVACKAEQHARGVRVYRYLAFSDWVAQRETAEH